MGTFNAGIFPSTTGLDLGSPSQQWDAYIRNLAVSGTTSGNAKTLNNIQFADQWGSLAAAYSALASTGGLVVVPSGYTETFTSNLTITKPNTSFLFIGSAQITLGNFQIIVSAGTHGVSFDSTVANGGADHTLGAIFNYSGTGSAFAIGSSSATTREFRFSNIGVRLTGGSGCTGLTLNSCVYGQLNCPAVTGNGTSGTIGIVLDGTGNYTGNFAIISPLISNVAVGIQGLGPFSNSMNAVTILGGSIQPIVSGGIGIDLQQGDANFIYGTDIESSSIALKLGANAINTYADFRSELNTTDVQGVAGSSYNTVRVRTQGGGPLSQSDAGTNNHFTRGVDSSIFDLFVTGTITSSGTGQFFVNTGSTIAAKYLRLGNTGNTGSYWGIESSVGGASFPGSAAYESVLYSPNNNIFISAPVARTSAALRVGSTITSYNGVSTAGQGVPPIVGITSQRAETAADNNVLTVTPAASAGTYRINFTLSLSAANTATIGWTATWKDSNGNDQSPTNLSLVQTGTAAPALTFTTSSAGDYHGTAVIDVDNSATAIVVKLTFSGTSFAGKASATVERLV